MYRFPFPVLNIFHDPRLSFNIGVDFESPVLMDLIVSPIFSLAVIILIKPIPPVIHKAIPLPMQWLHQLKGTAVYLQSSLSAGGLSSSMHIHDQAGTYFRNFLNGAKAVFP